MAIDKERLQELAALNAVGALDGEDAVEYQRLVADCAYLRQEIAGFNEVAARLAQTLPVTVRPSSALKASIMQRLGEAPTPDPRLAALSQLLPRQTEGFAFLAQAEASGWQRLRVPGAAFKLLSWDRERGYAVALGKLAPGAQYPAHPHHGPEDLYMLSGDLHIGSQVLQAGDYHHAAPGTAHPVNFTEAGCTLLIVLTTENLLAQLAAT